MTSPSVSFPHVILPDPARGQREGLDQARGRPMPRGPGRSAQATRLDPAFQALSTVMRNKTASIDTGPGGTDPELILVLEIIGNVEDFYVAVRRVEGLEFLAGIDEEDIPGGDDFIDEQHPDRLLDGTLFLLASNQQALEQILSLWQRFKDRPGEPWPTGLTGWRNVFDLLREVRMWGPQDRLRGTGVREDFAARAQAGAETVRAEVELWFRANEARRSSSEAEVRSAVATSGGEVIARAEIPEIAYHALLIDLPIAQVDVLLSEGPEAIALLRAEQVAFLRPEAQTLVPVEPHDGPPTATDLEIPLQGVSAEPVVALLDGLPMAGHVLLDGRVDLDDPDEFDAEVPAADRRHGTAITGAVLHGDLNAPSPGPSRVHLRPVLVPERGWNGGLVERLPADVLPADLFHSAVRRMVDPDDPDGPTAESIRIINVSVGDSNNQLATTLSPWARLMDWLSYKYRLLFIVSAGNHPRPMVVPVDWDEFAALDPSEQRALVLRALAIDGPYCRLLSPAEAVNVLTVGATHDDASAVDARGLLIDPLPKSGSRGDAAPGTYSARGSGYRRSVKPDVVVPGGRVLCQPPLPGQSGDTLLVPDLRPTSRAPGVRLATPGAEGILSGEFYWYGTSISAAIVTHHAGALAERLAEEPYAVPSEFIAPLTKAMIVHASSMGAGADELRQAWPDPDPNRIRDDVGRFFGYGVLQPDRLLGGTEERITLFGYGETRAEEGWEYEVPLPPSLSGKVARRRVAITLASLLPTRSQDRRYRELEVYFRPDLAKLSLSRADSGRHAVRRGSVQHEVLTGEDAIAFVDGDVLRVTVSCRPVLKPRFTEPVPYALVVTVEAEGIPVYQEIAQRVMRIRARAQARQRI